jgi:hypothetical protein
LRIFLSSGNYSVDPELGSSSQHDTRI